MNSENIQKLESISKSRFFTCQTASIYGGISGFYDMGPVFVGIKQNFVQEWRKHFIIHDNLFEMESSLLLPYQVLKASGHVDKFCDTVIYDDVNGNSYRADHYLTSVLKKKKLTLEIEEDLKKIDCLTCEEIDLLVKKYDIKTPDGNSFKPASKFNLMFETCCGAKDKQVLFLRPETAQGQFLNFRKLYEFNHRKMPFGSASIGKAFRNEISPRSGLIRTREFEQAEIEFFVSPENKRIAKFANVQHLKLPLYINENTINIFLYEAVQSKMIDNEILAYFMGRTYIFLKKVGINMDFVRFRQHKKDEMAHYAKDCWDVEIFSSCGWVECVGIADRSAYDLTCHSEASCSDLSFSETINPPHVLNEWKPVIDKKRWIKTLKNNFENFKNLLLKFTSKEIENMKITENGVDVIKVNFCQEIYTVECEQVETIIYERKVIPDVIEPSFGIGRILQILMEHLFYTRDCGRPVLRIPVKLAHVKCAISYVVFSEAYVADMDNLLADLHNKGISAEINNRSCSIGKKYASCDEIGIPFFVTFDNESINDRSVTVRERDSMKQIRLSIDMVVQHIIDQLNKQ